MNLILDIGNTRTKIGIFDKHQMILVRTYETLNTGILDEILRSHSVSHCMAIDSGSIPEFLIPYLNAKNISITLMGDDLKLPIKNSYETPKTLGKDRLAAVIGASDLHPGKDILIIDLGTAITYEYYINETYIGGNISPGLNLRYRSLHTYTSKLPLLSSVSSYNHPGSNTNDAIHAGVENGIHLELKGYIKEFRSNYPEGIIIFTGGDTDSFDKPFKTTIFVHENLVLHGINCLLEFNKN